MYHFKKLKYYILYIEIVQIYVKWYIKVVIILILYIFNLDFLNTWNCYYFINYIHFYV